jgi:hypothetical protein
MNSFRPWPFLLASAGCWLSLAVPPSAQAGQILAKSEASPASDGVASPGIRSEFPAMTFSDVESPNPAPPGAEFLIDPEAEQRDAVLAQQFKAVYPQIARATRSVDSPWLSHVSRTRSENDTLVESSLIDAVPSTAAAISAARERGARLVLGLELLSL